MKLKTFTLVALLVTVGNSGLIAQDNLHNNAFWNDANGRPLRLHTEFKTEGTPYYYEEYCLADIHLTNGKKYQNVRVKLNLVENDVVFINDKNEELVTTSPVKKIKFYNYFHNGVSKQEVTLVSLQPKLNEKGSEVYELLVDSTAKLLKKVAVTFNDSKGYNEAGLTRTYNKSETLYALLPGDEKPVKLQKNKNSVIELFTGKKQNQVAGYIEKNNIRCKTQEDLMRVFSYYNTL